MAVAGVLAEAEVGDHDQLGVRLLDRLGRELDDTLVVPRPGPFFVLGGRKPEQEHRWNFQLRRLASFGHGVRDREPVDPGHRRDRFTPVDPVRDEHRIHEIPGRQVSLTYESAQRMRSAQPAQASLRERHRS